MINVYLNYSEFNTSNEEAVLNRHYPFRLCNSSDFNITDDYVNDHYMLDGTKDSYCIEDKTEVRPLLSLIPY